LDGAVSGLFTDYHYYGTGDVGGAPDEASVKLLESTVTNAGGGPLHVVSATAEQMFLDIKPNQTARLPRYKGEMELTNHSAGSLTSEAYLKRWNRKNELLADAAEKSSVAAELLGGRPYPLDRLNNAWTLVMGGQFHDITPGTSTPKAYEFSWNDEVLAMNQFAGVVASATEAVASGMDTQARGAAIVVYNPLNVAREDVVEAAVGFPGGTPKAVRVTGPDGKAVPAQLSNGKVLFVAKAPSVGYAVYDVEPAEAPAAGSTLKVTGSSLENARYRVTIDPNGDIGGIFDKAIKKELLLTPARLEIKTEKPVQYPAWNMDWDDQSRPPRAYVGGPARVRIVENGPARVAIEVSRETEGSKFVQTIRLSSGDAANRVEIGNVIDWNTKGSHLKADFPLTATNPVATYNWDIGAIERGTDNPRKFEVPSHQWVDLTDRGGAYGATVLTDCKNGSDKPDDNTLRLTLIRTPGTHGSYDDQATQDVGHHEFVYGLAGHAGDWRKGQTDWQAYRLNQPLIAFEASKHAGALGKTWSLLSVSHSRVRVLALKKAEQSDEVIVRLVELDGKPASDVQIAFAAPITAAREVNGAEEPVGAATVTNGKLVTSFTAFQPRTFAVKLGGAPAKVVAVHSQPVKLDYDLAAASNDGTNSVSGFASDGRALPAEMLPAELAFSGVEFNLAPARTGTPDAVVAKGQTIQLPAGKFNRVYVLAASADGDQKVAFRVGEKAVDATIQDWGGFIGQWDNRIWQSREVPVPARAGAPARTRTDPYGEMVGLKPGFIKRAQVAWFASHRHTAGGANEPYAYSYLFAYPLDVPAGATTLTLPDNQNIRILAISVAQEGATARPAQPLYDTLER
jgi:alpha-mannosidase